MFVQGTGASDLYKTRRLTPVKEVVMTFTSKA
jgi:hypothetical protein